MVEDPCDFACTDDYKPVCTYVTYPDGTGQQWTFSNGCALGNYQCKNPSYGMWCICYCSKHKFDCISFDKFVGYGPVTLCGVNLAV